MRKERPTTAPVHLGLGVVAAALGLVALACGSGGGMGLETARQDTFGFVYAASHQQAARTLHVEWNRGPLAVGRARPFSRDSVSGPARNITDLWGGAVQPGDTAVFVLGFEGEKPQIVVHCFGQVDEPLPACF